MTRIADALAKRHRHALAEVLGETDHGWGSGLSAELDTYSDSIVGASAGTARSAKGQAIEAPAGVPAPPIDAEIRTHLSGLVDRLFLTRSVDPVRSVAFSGVGVRSAPITASVAELLAQQTASSVCVVDAHFAKPTLHEHFGVPNEPGLTDAAFSDVALADMAREVRPNVWLLSNGGGKTRPSFTFASDTGRVRIAQLLARFDFVLVDVEPSSTADDSLAALLSGGVVLVVSASATRRDTARRAATLFHRSGATVVGAVLTDRRFPIPEAIYQRL